MRTRNASHVNSLRYKDTPAPPPLTIDRGEGEKLEWEVGEVVNSRLKRKVIYYKVRWKGGQITEQPWRDLLPGCEDLVTEFHAKYPRKAGPPAEFENDSVAEEGSVRSDAATRGGESVSDHGGDETPACTDAERGRAALFPRLQEPTPIRWDSSSQSASPLQQDVPIMRLPLEVLEHV